MQLNARKLFLPNVTSDENLNFQLQVNYKRLARCRCSRHTFLLSEAKVCPKTTQTAYLSKFITRHMARKTACLLEVSWHEMYVVNPAKHSHPTFTPRPPHANWKHFFRMANPACGLLAVGKPGIIFPLKVL